MSRAANEGGYSWVRVAWLVVGIACASPGARAAEVTPGFQASSATPYIRQWGRYQAYVPGVRAGADSNQWTVTLKGVLPGSTLYVVGVWPNYYSLYPNMGVADGRNVYAELDRIDDTTLFATGIQGTESMGHWYAPAVAGGTYRINMSPSPATYEDYAALVVFEIAGTNAGVLDAHRVALARNVAPGRNALSIGATGSVSNSLLVSVAFDEVSGSAPTVPVPGTSMQNVASLWNFLGSSLWSARAASRVLTAPGPTQGVFSAQENDAGYAPPNYLLSAAIFE